MPGLLTAGDPRTRRNIVLAAGVLVLKSMPDRENKLVLLVAVVFINFQERRDLAKES